MISAKSWNKAGQARLFAISIKFGARLLLVLQVWGKASIGPSILCQPIGVFPQIWWSTVVLSSRTDLGNVLLRPWKVNRMPQKHIFLEGFCPFFVLFFATSRTICTWHGYFLKKLDPTWFKLVPLGPWLHWVRLGQFSLGLLSIKQLKTHEVDGLDGSLNHLTTRASLTERY